MSGTDGTSVSRPPSSGEPSGSGGAGRSAGSGDPQRQAGSRNDKPAAGSGGAPGQAPPETGAQPLGRVREPRRSEALPGELKPLEWSPRRGPITDAEALGVLRRRRRVELAGPPKARGRRSPVPAELPSADAPRKPTMFRLPPRLLARAHARAELEAVPLTTIIEELLADYASGDPLPPQEVHERLRDQGLKWQRR